MLQHKLFEGMQANYERDISPSHTSVFGELDYLMSTPQIVEMIIRAATEMLDPLLPEPYTTIGTHFDIHHEQPTLVQEGGTVQLQLTLIHLEGNKIRLRIECFDRIGRICTAHHDRAIVEKERFRFSTYERAGSFPL